MILTSDFIRPYPVSRFSRFVRAFRGLKEDFKSFKSMRDKDLFEGA
jgi:hypothetical protein